MSKVLIVEDNPANLSYFSAALKFAGYEIFLADNALAGIQLAREQLPDLILMDIQLPGMDGMEATRVLKADPATRHIPIYALTAFAMKGDEDHILSAGCDGYLAKPVSYKDLLDTAARAISPNPP